MKKWVYKHRIYNFQLEIMYMEKKEDGLWMTFRWNPPEYLHEKPGRVSCTKIRMRKDGSLYFRSFKERWSLRDFEGLLP